MGRLSRTVGFGLVCLWADKASVMITTGWRRPCVLLPRVACGCLGDPIRGHPRRLCMPTPKGRETFVSILEMSAEAQPGSVESVATQGAPLARKLLACFSRPASPNSGFDLSEGDLLRQSLTACLAVASGSSVLNIATLYSSVLQKRTQEPVFQIGEGNSKFVSHWDANLSPCSKLQSTDGSQPIILNYGKQTVPSPNIHIDLPSDPWPQRCASLPSSGWGLGIVFVAQSANLLSESPGHPLP